MQNTKIFTTAFASVYPHYIQKAEKKDAPNQRFTKLSAGLPAMMNRACNNNWNIEMILKLFSTRLLT